MATLKIRPPEECKWDCVSLSEIMIRLDPGEGRTRTTQHFRVWEGGGARIARQMVSGLSNALKQALSLDTEPATCY